MNTIATLSMTPSPQKREGITSSGIINIIQIAVLLTSLGMIYEKFEETAALVGTHSRQLNRIEHYLSSKDSKYWDREDRNGDQ